MAQSLSQKSVLSGQQFSRINRRVSTNGISVEVDVGAAAIFVGPDSDFACYGVYYFDPSSDFKTIQVFGVARSIGGGWCCLRRRRWRRRRREPDIPAERRSADRLSFRKLAGIGTGPR